MITPASIFAGHFRCMAELVLDINAHRLGRGARSACREWPEIFCRSLPFAEVGRVRGVAEAAISLSFIRSGPTSLPFPVMRRKRSPWTMRSCPFTFCESFMRYSPFSRKHRIRPLTSRTLPSIRMRGVNLSNVRKMASLRQRTKRLPAGQRTTDRSRSPGYSPQGQLVCRTGGGCFLLPPKETSPCLKI